MHSAGLIPLEAALGIESTATSSGGVSQPPGRTKRRRDHRWRTATQRNLRVESFPPRRRRMGPANVPPIKAIAGKQLLYGGWRSSSHASSWVHYTVGSEAPPATRNRQGTCYQAGKNRRGAAPLTCTVASAPSIQLPSKQRAATRVGWRFITRQNTVFAGHGRDRTRYPRVAAWETG